MPLSSHGSRLAWSRRLPYTVAFAGFIVLAIALQSVGRCAAPPLPSDYGLFHLNAATVVLLGPIEATSDPRTGSIVVAAKISRLNVSRGFVYGFVEPSPQSELAGMETPGFFIVNTATHEVERGLSSSAYEVRLGQLGLPKDLLSARRFQSRIPIRPPGPIY
jgi:hypothetical protein